MAKSRNGLVSAGLTVLGFLFLLLAFTSHSWVVSNGRVNNAQFQSIGKKHWGVSLRFWQFLGFLGILNVILSLIRVICK